MGIPPGFPLFCWGKGAPFKVNPQKNPPYFPSFYFGGKGAPFKVNPQKKGALFFPMAPGHLRNGPLVLVGFPTCSKTYVFSFGCGSVVYRLGTLVTLAERETKSEKEHPLQGPRVDTYSLELGGGGPKS